MAKQFDVFWRISNTSIQEPAPHHTALCKRCGYLYNRHGASASCPHCGIRYNKIIKKEFYVSKGKKRIFTGRGLEEKRGLL